MCVHCMIQKWEQCVFIILNKILQWFMHFIMSFSRRMDSELHLGPVASALIGRVRDNE